jgi:hypothetical protein
MAYVIFDLDGTVICSKHRYRDLPNGSIDLQYWFDMATPENVAKDSLLPLAGSMQRLFDRHTIIICTARTMQAHDWQYLAENNLKFHHALYRRDGDMRHDADMKTALLTEFFAERNTTAENENVVMFDDNLHVIDAMRKMSIHCFNAERLNARTGLMVA